MDELSPRAVRRELREAIERLYEVFAGYPLGLMNDTCTCGCVSPEDQARIRSKPLRLLTAQDLGRYTFKATTTWGNADDFKHFVPRILELVAYTGCVDYVDPEIAFGKLGHAEWRTWPAQEQDAVERFLMALWRRVLVCKAAVEVWVPYPWRAGDCLCAIGQIVDDLQPYLQAWRESDSPNALHHLAVSVLGNFADLALDGALGDAFWEDREEQMRQVKHWLLGRAARDMLERPRAWRDAIPAGLCTGTVEGALRAAADRLRRVLPPFERPQDRCRRSAAGTLFDATYEMPVKWLFLTVSGAHLYGFPSPDSDYDLRGAHVLPAPVLLGLDAPKETLEKTTTKHDVRIELVSHDVRKYFRLLLNRNGYVLEQIFSPLVVQTSRECEEFQAIARTCITRGHAAHYLGFAEQQWKLVQKKGPTIKSLLYLYRVLLTGIHLMRTGEVEANLLRLNEHFGLPYLAEMIAQKVSGHEKDTASAAELALHERENLRLRDLLEAAAAASSLPAAPSGRAALNDLLLRLRAAASEAP